MTDRTLLSPLWFAGSVALVYATAWWILQAAQPMAHADVLGLGLSLDMVLVVPALYYFLMVRGRGWPVLSVLPVTGASLAIALKIIPEPSRGALDVIVTVLPAIELVAVGLVIRHGAAVVRRLRAQGREEADFFDSLRHSMSDMLPERAATAAAYEVALFRYAFAVARPPVNSGDMTYDRRSGYGAVVFAVGLAAALELTAGHFLLMMWSPVAAWVHLGLAAYGMIWIVGDLRAMRYRPHRISESTMIIRCGLRWQVDVPLEEIDRVVRSRRPLADTAYLNTAPIGDPRLIILLRKPVEALGPYGIRKSISQIGIIADDLREAERTFAARGIAVDG